MKYEEFSGVISQRRYENGSIDIVISDGAESTTLHPGDFIVLSNKTIEITPKDYEIGLLNAYPFLRSMILTRSKLTVGFYNAKA